MNRKLTKGARTHERILQTAADLFHAQGMNATSLGDVLRASNAGKGQFYQHFESREDLLQQVLQRHAAYLHVRDHAPITTWDDLRRWMDDHLSLQAHFDFARGCPVGTAAYALQSSQTDARAELKHIFDVMRDRISRFLQQERQAGNLQAEADPQRLADFVVACVQGGLLLGLLERGPGPVQNALDEGFAHLRSYVLESTVE